MHYYIALLRGINVSGKNIIKMADLKSVLHKNGFPDAKTYIQSGNIVFKSNTNDITFFEKTMSDLIEKKFGCVVTVMVYPLAFLQTVVNNVPFSNMDSSEFNRYFATFLKEKPIAGGFESFVELKKESEQLILDNSIIYMHCPEGVGKSKLSNNALESKLKTTATTRNWRTILKLIEMCS